ncbi:hypothetical protein D1872_346820 [compost metagenome]
MMPNLQHRIIRTGHVDQIHNHCRAQSNEQKVQLGQQCMRVHDPFAEHSEDDNRACYNPFLETSPYNDREGSQNI